MDDTKSLIEKYKRELMELGKSAPKAAAPEPAPQKKPAVIGYVTEESGEFPAVFDRIIAQAVENNEVEDKRDSPEGYPDIDAPEDEIAFSPGRGNEGETTRPEDDQDQGTGETISNFPVSSFSTYEQFEAENTGGGTLVFMVFTAREALPVEGAAVTVSTRINGESREMFSCVTNQSGETEARTLPAPSKSLSQEYDNEVQPFSLYDATIAKEGFTKVILRDIPVFDGVQSIQRVAMIPAESAEGVRNAE